MTLDRIAWSWTEYVIYISLRTVVATIPLVKSFDQKEELYPLVAVCNCSKKWDFFCPQSLQNTFPELCPKPMRFTFAFCTVQTTASKIRIKLGQKFGTTSKMENKTLSYLSNWYHSCTCLSITLSSFDRDVKWKRNYVPFAFALSLG